jgi:hypothetical protein
MPSDDVQTAITLFLRESTTALLVEHDTLALPDGQLCPLDETWQPAAISGDTPEAFTIVPGRHEMPVIEVGRLNGWTPLTPQQQALAADYKVFSVCYAADGLTRLLTALPWAEIIPHTESKLNMINRKYIICDSHESILAATAFLVADRPVLWGNSVVPERALYETVANALSAWVASPSVDKWFKLFELRSANLAAIEDARQVEGRGSVIAQWAGDILLRLDKIVQLLILTIILKGNEDVLIRSIARNEDIRETVKRCRAAKRPRRAHPAFGMPTAIRKGA